MANQYQENCNILRRDQVIGRTGLSRSTIYSLIQQGEFPKQIQLSPRSVGWLEIEIDLWLKSRIEQRDLCGEGNE